MQRPYTVVRLEQGTREWLAWRSRGIGASDAPAIMGENPWKSRARLLREKCGDVTSFTPNAAMARGTRLEPHARRRYETCFGIPVEPACLQSTRFHWLRASVDGLAHDGEAVVEIKCGESVYLRSATTGKVPAYYHGQLQHILAVTGLSAIDFWCWLPRRPEVHIRVDRDDAYIRCLLDAERLFWEEIESRRCRLA